MPQENAETSFIVRRVQNDTDSAEGSALPPRQIGANRVPLVMNLRVLTIASFVGGTQFKLGFDEPVTRSQISNYNLYYSINGSGDQVNAGTCRRSPAIFNVAGPAAQVVAFTVQTNLQNGFISDLSLSPSCTAKTLAAAVTPADLAGLNLVFGGSNLTTVGLIPYVSGGALLDDSPLLQFDSGVGNFANSAGSPTAAFTTDRDVAFGVDPTVRTANFTVANYWFVPVDTTAGNVTATLPAAAGLPGQWYVFKKVSADANVLTVSRAGADLIDGAATITTSAAYGRLSVVRSAAAAWSVV